MAQKVEVLLVCDLHDEEVEGSETIAFALDGSSYEVDACDEHAAALRDAFAPFVGAARRAGRPAVAAPSSRRSRPAARTPDDSGEEDRDGDRDRDKDRVQQVREWGRENGFTVSERGRLPGKVVEAYDAAH